MASPAPRSLNRRFQVGPLLGKGSFGTVYEGVDLAHPSQPIAIKILTARSRESAHRLGEEFRALAGLSHPNIAQVLEFGVDQDSGEPFYTMERIRGRDFVTALQKAGPEETLELVAQGLRALAYLHSREWAHGDVKPANLLVQDPGGTVAAHDRVKLLDFGLARLTQGERPPMEEGWRLAPVAPKSVIQKHTVLPSPSSSQSLAGGTALYLAPELIRGAAPSPLSDLYSFGALVYHAACGQPPFKGSFNELVQAHLKEPPRPPRAITRTVPDALDAVLMRLLTKEPNDRYGSAREALEALGRFSGRDLPLETPQIRALRLTLSPFVGREAEMKLLKAELDLLVMGRPHSGLILLTGEPGIGKTRLAREFCHHMQIYGVEVLKETCSREGRGALRPLVEPLRRLFCTAPDAVQDLYFADVSRLIPGLTCPVLPAEEKGSGGAETGSYDLPAEPEAEPEPETGTGDPQEDARISPLKERLIQFLLHRAKNPIALVLDDLHWADSGTFDLIAALASRAARRRILVVGILKDLQIARKRTMVPLKPTEIRLAPLPDAQIEALARGLSPSGELDPEVARKVAAASGGNPFFAEETMRLLQESEEGAGALPIPESVARVMRARLTRLSPGSRAAAEALAAFDRPVSLLALGRVLDKSHNEIEGWIADLIARRLARADDELPGHVRLVQAAFGDVLNQESDPERLRSLHGRIAQYLTVLAEEGREHLHEEIASHYQAAGLTRPCLDHTLVAARRAERIFNHEAALELFDRALSMVEESDLSLRLRIEEELARAAESSGEVEGSLTHWSSARTLARTLGELATEVRILGEIGRIHLSKGDLVKAREHLDEGFAKVKLPELVREYAHLADLQARAHLSAAAAEEALEFCEKGQSELEAQGHERDAALTYTGACALAIHGRSKEALEAFTRAGALARNQENPLVLLRSLLSMSEVLVTAGNTQRATELAREALGIASFRRDVPRQSAAHWILADIALLQGDITAAQSHVDESKKLAQKMGYQHLVHEALHVQAGIDLLQGRFASALESLWRTFQGHRKSSPEEGFGQAQRESDMGRVYLEIGDLKKARSFLERARMRLERIHAPSLKGQVLLALGIVDLKDQRLARAESSIKESLQILIRLDHRLSLARAHLALADLYLTRGEPARAQSPIESALAFAQEAGALPLLVQAQCQLGRTLQLSDADPARARELLAAAQTRALSLNIPDLVVRTGLAMGQLLKRLGEENEAREAYRHGVLALKDILGRMMPEQAAHYSADPDRSRLLAEWAACKDAPSSSVPGEKHPLHRGEELMEAIGRINECLSTDPTETLRRLLEVSLSLSGAERAAILTPAPKGGLAVSLMKAQSGQILLPRLFQYSRTMVEQAIQERRPLHANDASPTEPLSPSASVMSLDLKSILVLPLAWNDHLYGVLYLDSHSVTRSFTPLDFELLSLFARHASIAMANNRYFKENEELRSRLQSENVYLREEIRQASHFTEIVGESPAIQKALNAVEKVAPTESTVLIRGETGTGKELFARAVHSRSQRAGKPLIKVNISALPGELIEAELFGHEKGAFTGAVQRRIGRFELAHEGTIFLDEIGDLPPSVQVKLLRVLQEREFERLGSSRTQSVDCRVIAATNRDLEGLIARGQFREDLFYRLNVFPIPLPPLRERDHDVLKIAAHLIARIKKASGSRVSGIDEIARQRLLSYRWPGNVRELANVIERAMILSPGAALTLEPLEDPVKPGDGAGLEFPTEGLSLSKTLQDVKVSLVKEALRRSDGNQAQAARLLGLQRSNLNRLIKELQITS